MVCERPRKRSLLINRRGTFFEDPFFRDSWDDYNSAVRRIVDRFNHGWVSPSERIRDSQYQSMYRTLRTAKLNYSTHSAKFKEEENGYKLVMDVHEFVGGDITVRTAGSTVSVRGKLEEKPNAARDDDDSSIISGRSSGTKTLHRRFTLPPEADCDKIESSISKDAVLTVIIPKKEVQSDVRYIPVKIEGRETLSKPPFMEEDKRNGGIKRPNDSPLLSSRKKQQEENTDRNQERTGWRSRFRDLMENKENDGGSRENFSKRRSRFEPDDVNQTESYKKRNKSTAAPEKEEPKERRRLSKKYEDAHEIHIPLKFDNNENTEDKVYTAGKIPEPKVHHIEIVQEPESPQINDKLETNHLLESPQLSKNLPEFNKPSEEPGDVKEIPKSMSKRRSWTKFRSDENGISENGDDASPKSDLPWRLNRISSIRTRPHSFDPASSSLKEEPMKFDGINPQPLKIKEVNPSSFFQIPKERSIDSDKDSIIVKSPDHVPLTPQSSVEKEVPTVDIQEVASNEVPELPINENDNLHVDRKLDTLETPTLSTAMSKSPPLSPGGREVLVEKRQSLMEDDIFKDCWSDFSHTLQDVLNRLQELSTELGQSKNNEEIPPKEAADKPKESVPPRVSVVQEMQEPSSSENPGESSQDDEEESPSEKEDGTTTPIIKNETSDEEVEVPARSARNSIASDISHTSVSFTLDLTKKKPVKKIEVPSLEDILDEPHKRPTSLVLEKSTEDSVVLDSSADSPVKVLQDSSPPVRGSPPTSPSDCGLSITINSEGKDVSDTDLDNENHSRLAPTRDALSPDEVQSYSSSPRSCISPLLASPLATDDVKILTESSSHESVYENARLVPSSDDVESEVDKEEIQEIDDLSKESFVDDGSDVNEYTAFPFDDDSFVNGEVSHSPFNSCENLSSDPEPMLNDDNYKAWKSSILTDRVPSPVFEYRKGLYGVKKRPPLRENLDNSHDAFASKPSSNDVISSKPHENNDVTVRKHKAQNTVDHPHVRTPRSASAKSECHRVSAPHKQRLRNQDSRKQGHEPTPLPGDMGNILSRGRSNHASSRDSLPSSPKGTSPTKTDRYPLRSGKSQESSDDAPLPTYIKQKTEPPKKSGFSHINSNNVRRMRDAWSKQDSKSQEKTDPLQKDVPSPTSKRGPSSPSYSAPWRQNSPTRNSRGAPSSPRDKASSRPYRRHSPSPSRRSATSPPPKTRPTSYTADPKSPRLNQRISSPLTSRAASSRSNRPSSPLTSAKKHPYSGTTGMGSARSPYSGRKQFEPSFLSEKNKPRESSFSESSRRTGTVPNFAPGQTGRSFETNGNHREHRVPNVPEAHQRIFKRFRNANLQPDSEALCFKEEEDRYKMVLDVQEFAPGEIEVLQDDRVLTVKGKVETRDGNNMSLRTFHRNFDIPQNSREEEVDSNLSEDGILTIYVPKKKERIIKIELVD